MRNYFKHLIVLFKRIVLLLVLFQFCRLYFYFFNISHFENLSFSELLKIFFFGTRFDYTAIIYLFSVFILLHLIPFRFVYKNSYQKFLKLFFIIETSFVLLPNFIDSQYFQFIKKRSTSDFFSLISLGDDVIALLPQYLYDFWFVVLSWLLTIIISYFAFPKLKNINLSKRKISGKNIFIQSLISIIILSILYTGARGIELKPIRIITAAKYTDAQNIPLLLNTPFTIVTTFYKKELATVEYFDKNELKKYYNPVKNYKSNDKFKNYNVVIIILESFAEEYLGTHNEKGGYTPFLDSLMKKSLVFENSYANGKKSIEALPAILASIPALSENPYITSIYSANQINSIASILKSKNYHSSFFHGGSNGTMGFDNFVEIAGIEKYYGRNEYNNEVDYDGNWGIYDEEFLQFFAKKLDSFSEPFFASVFTLSSHHPYSIPEKYKDKFKSGNLPIHQAIRYTDYSLKKFFETASKKSWYQNTLFVLTADHTEKLVQKKYKTRTGIYEIPIIFFQAADSNLHGISQLECQQIDIMPSILDYLHYDSEFISFGNSVFDSTNTGFAVNYLNDIYQLIENKYVMQFDNTKIIGLYNLENDSLLKHNLKDTDNKQIEYLSNHMKAIIQSYNTRLINNDLTITK